MTKRIVTNHFPRDPNTPQYIMLPSNAKYLKATVAPGVIHVHHLVDHTNEDDNVPVTFVIETAGRPIPPGFDYMDTVVVLGHELRHIYRESCPGSLREVQNELIDETPETNNTKEKATTETTFHFEASHFERISSRVEIEGECKFDGIFLLLERFSTAGPGEQCVFVKKLIDNAEAKYSNDGYSLEMFTIEKWVEVKAKRDADRAAFQQRSEAQLQSVYGKGQTASC